MDFRLYSHISTCVCGLLLQMLVLICWSLLLWADVVLASETVDFTELAGAARQITRAVFILSKSIPIYLPVYTVSQKSSHL